MQMAEPKQMMQMLGGSYTMLGPQMQPTMPQGEYPFHGQMQMMYGMNQAGLNEQYRSPGNLALQGACRTALARLELKSGDAMRDNVLMRILQGAADDLQRDKAPLTLSPVRENKDGRSPFQLEVDGKRIVAQKAIYAAYHSLSAQMVTSAACQTEVRRQRLAVVVLGAVPFRTKGHRDRLG